MALSDVAEEILLHIVSYIQSDNPTLARLSRCNKRLHQVITPILYTYVQLCSEEPDKFRKLRHFTHAVAGSPLGQCVKYISLDGLDWHCTRNSTETDLATKPDYTADLDPSKLRAVVQGLPIADTAHQLAWLNALSTPNPDALVAVLLASVPSLTRLETPLSSSAVFVSYLLTHLAGRGQHILDHLAQLKAEGDLHYGDTCLLVPLLGIPPLTHLFASSWGPGKDRFCKTDGEDDDGDCTPSQSPSPSITHLELQNCMLNDYHLTKLLRPCSALHTFILHRIANFHSLLTASDITTALHHLRYTLKWLSLSYSPHTSTYDEDDEINPLDFSAFSALTRLCLAAGYLVRDPSRPVQAPHDHHCDPAAAVHNAKRPLHARLPSSLEELQVRGPSTPIQVRDLIASLREVVSQSRRGPRLQGLGYLSIEAGFGVGGQEFDTMGLEEEARRGEVEVEKFHNTYVLRGETWEYEADSYHWGFDCEFEWRGEVEGDWVTDVVGLEDEERQ